VDFLQYFSGSLDICVQLVDNDDTSLTISRFFKEADSILVSLLVTIYVVDPDVGQTFLNDRLYKSIGSTIGRLQIIIITMFYDYQIFIRKSSKLTPNNIIPLGKLLEFSRSQIRS
jgi:hypothetical protein